MEIRDKSGAKNSVADHLSRLENRQNGKSDCFPNETLCVVTDRLPSHANIANCILIETFPEDLSRAQKEKIRAQSKYYVWDEPYLNFVEIRS